MVMRFLLIMLVAANSSGPGYDAFAPTQIFTVGFDSKSACEFVASWATNEQTKAICIPALEAMWNQPLPTSRQILHPPSEPK